MIKENEFTKTFEEWYEDWFKKPFPTDKEGYSFYIKDDTKAFGESEKVI